MSKPNIIDVKIIKFLFMSATNLDSEYK